MKLLIIGIDGGTEEIFDFFRMPNWQRLKQNAMVIPAREDLLHRGWAKMLSGQLATENGSFYFRPVLDGSRQFTISYSFSSLARAPGFAPIWSFPIDADARVGIMNVPTAAPAQEVPGFFVAGGGGGVYQSGMPRNACYPAELERSLLEQEYIFDVRLGTSSFHSPAVLLSRLNTMMARRARVFCDLARKERIDFGFLAFRATSVVLYLAMSEIEQIMRANHSDPSSSVARSRWPELIQEHMRELDTIIGTLLEKLGPENFMIVSDHSMVPYRYDADLNFCFRSAGLSASNSSPLRFAKNIAKFALKTDFRQILSQINGFGGKWRALRMMGASPKPSSLVFGHHYVSGAYVNDHRFNGPVTDGQRDAVVDQAIDCINESSAVAMAGWRAVPYRRHFMNHFCSDSAPDIKIEHDGSTFFNSNAGCLIRANENYGPVDSMKGVSGMHSGQKGDRPLLVLNRELASRMRSEDPHDLRLVHRLTQRLFS
jgi:hypothetical protein